MGIFSRFFQWFTRKFSEDEDIETGESTQSLVHQKGPWTFFTFIFPPFETSQTNETIFAHVNEYLDYCKKILENNSIYLIAPDIKSIINDSDYIPNFKELEIEVTAQFAYSINIINAYKVLREKLFNISREWKNPSTRPLLIISDHKSFHKSNVDEHRNVTVKNVVFGAFRLSFEFMNYVSLEKFTFKKKINFNQNEIYIPFKKPNTLLNKFTDRMLDIPYGNIGKILIDLYHDKSSIAFYLDLYHPPLLYGDNDNNLKSFIFNHLPQVLQFNRLKPQKVKRERKFQTSHLTKDLIGRAHVIQIILPNCQKTFEIINFLQCLNRCIPIYYYSMSQKPNSEIFSSSSIQSSSYIKFDKDFLCEYLLVGIFQRNFSIAEQWHKVSSKQLKSQIKNLMSSADIKSVQKALTWILAAIDNKNIIFFPQALISCLQYLEMYNVKNDIHLGKYQHYYYIPQIIITPTRFLLYNPETVPENNFLRNYDPNFALKIKIREDDMSILGFYKNYESNFFENLKERLLLGIGIGNRIYKFLGWSNSQIQEHSMWYYAQDNDDCTVSIIRNEAGDLSHIKSVSKYISRIGLIFSQSRHTKNVLKHNIRIEPDIVGGWDSCTSKPYCFSDGIGKISSYLSAQVRKKLGNDKHCSAFQIRYGGCKGVLVEDPNLRDAAIVFRESMVKYNSEDISLGIVKTSAPRKIKLNRPLISILNQLGVSDEIFSAFLHRQLYSLKNASNNDDDAVYYLNKNTPFSIFNFHALSRSGMSLLSEPFFRSLLASTQAYCLEKFKTKANIDIHPNEARCMYGVLDETGTLEYGQVFVQYSRNISDGKTTLDTVILQDTVVVTKNPCMHPGDVRKFTAIDVPELHHIRDCIVFPSKGKRPHPNEMAGSDLDGDEYHVIWAKELIFKRNNVEPADFPPMSGPKTNNITDEKIIDFLMEFIQNNNVGVVANAQLAQSDHRGMFHQTSRSIANIFNIIIDYAKSGVHRDLSPHQKPELFPDFMEKDPHKTYESQRALGIIFRVCQDLENSSLFNIEIPDVKVDYRMVYPNWNIYKHEATENLQRYNTSLAKIMANYGIQNETDLFSGNFTFQRADNDLKHKVFREVTLLCNKTRKEFFSDTSKKKKPKDHYLQKASAWYFVAYQNKKFLSFPWIISDFMAKVYSYNLST